MMREYPRLYGLIGFPLSHSFSKRYFTEKFAREGLSDSFYELFPIERVELVEELWRRHANLRGLNVTIPYKQAVMTYLDELDTEAAAVGAVNTIAIIDDRRVGYNTDVYGFERSLRRWLDALAAPKPRAALVLGAGGGAKAVAFALDKMGIAWKGVSRHRGKAALTYEDLDEAILALHPLIVNTTPLGMAPHTDTAPPMPYEWLSPAHLLYDLVYNPEKTLFLSEGEALGCPVKNGLEMLHLQAERAWEIWNRLPHNNV